MMYRPEEFWPKHTEVTLTSSWVEDGLATFDPSRSFSIGREQILSIRQGTQMGTLYRNGRLIREVPVSLGKPTWETTSGIKTVMERYYVKRMVNPGPREPYDVQVPFALRITPSGEYLHAAPWNTYNLGVAPTSHGCTNMSMQDGQWFYEHALEGDPVIFFGTGIETDWDEGPGASWNIDWADWQANSSALP
jgi:lipoprotein-anchoring transpeptidase ErfK/SrfK